MTAQEKITIVGIGENGLDGLTAAARKRVLGAELLIGERKILEMIPPGDSTERYVVEDSLDEAVGVLQDASQSQIVVLADGDPLFYGVARFFFGKLGKERFEVVPHVSSMQLAFARVMESWEDAYLTNLASQHLSTAMGRIRTAEKVGLFTTEDCPPSAVAAEMVRQGVDYFTVYVCENLNSPDERVTSGSLAEIAEQTFSPLNVMILIRKPDVPDRPKDQIGLRLFGNPDDRFVASKPKRALATPSELRSIALSEMDLGPSSIVWDIGAGFGAVAIEAARIASSGSVYAIEPDIDDLQRIRENAERFSVTDVLTPVLGRAPEVFGDLPDPDAVFIGGVGRSISKLAAAAYDRLRPGGRIAATTASINNLDAIHRSLQSLGGDVRHWMISIARGAYQFDQLRYESVNPAFLITAIKQ